MPETRTHRILIAGSGGQGNIILGRLLATVALRNVPHITFFPNYGAEVRGGMSNCQVILSDREMASPLAGQFEAMIVMSQPGAEKYLSGLVPSGVAVINTSLCRVPSGPNRVQVPATEQADRLGDTRVANFLLLGVLLARRPVVAAADMEAAIRQMFHAKQPSVAALNIKAFQAGLAWTP